ncbi:12309_t:CDS:2, partial [Racocetra persica]
ESCKIIGGTTFFLFSFNVTLNGALSLTTYLRICKEIAIDLGIYDYKLFLSITLISLILTLIGIHDYASFSVNFGGIGNTILYIIYENWKNQYDNSLENSDYSNNYSQNNNG